jgi:hypothetical protein
MCDGRDTRVSDLSARGWWQDPPSSTRPSSWQDTAPDLRHLLPAGALSLSLSQGRPAGGGEPQRGRGAASSRRPSGDCCSPTRLPSPRRCSLASPAVAPSRGWINSCLLGAKLRSGAARDRTSMSTEGTTVLQLAIWSGSTSPCRPFARRRQARRLR